jgi:hypothetical protein
LVFASVRKQENLEIRNFLFGLRAVRNFRLRESTAASAQKLGRRVSDIHCTLPFLIGGNALQIGENNAPQ